MKINKKQHPEEKESLHPRNKHRERYNFEELIAACSDLAPFVKKNQFGDETINFSDPEAVINLNKAILKKFYEIDYWTIPQGFLCPPVPGRADYIHNCADLLSSSNEGLIPTGAKINCLDVGVGTNCIYPIIGNREYGWSFTGGDIEEIAVQSASSIVGKNEKLKGNINIRLQSNAFDTFRGIIKDDEHYDITLCNPPFHASLADAEKASLRKLSNLTKTEATTVKLNFGGKGKELYCNGGEERFVLGMIKQSVDFKDSCLWFTSLVSKQENIRTFKKALKAVTAVDVRVLKMSQGTKISRILAWTFQTEEQQKAWAVKYWVE